jgi:predicted ribosomally synthesized peptide with SipW-like signal peptide
MKRIFGLSVAFMLFIGMTGSGAWAYFNDVEPSTGNELTSGTLDLRTDDADGVTQTLYATSMKPGSIIGPSTIQLKNAGDTDGTSLDIEFSYIESDGSPNNVNMTANATAAMMEVTSLSYNSVSLLTGINDNNVNGYKDLQDLADADLGGLAGLSTSATKPFEIEIKLNDNLSNDFRADGITAVISFTLNQ